LVHIICFAITLPKHYSFTASPIRSYRRLYRRNRINKNGHSAVWAYKEGGGTIEDNDLRGNALGAWNTSADSEPNLKRARNKE
jgi:hypothetical protein